MNLHRLIAQWTFQSKPRGRTLHVSYCRGLLSSYADPIAWRIPRQYACDSPAGFLVFEPSRRSKPTVKHINAVITSSKWPVIVLGDRYEVARAKIEKDGLRKVVEDLVADWLVEYEPKASDHWQTFRRKRRMREQLEKQRESQLRDVDFILGCANADLFAE